MDLTGNTGSDAATVGTTNRAEMLARQQRQGAHAGQPGVEVYDTTAPADLARLSDLYDPDRHRVAVGSAVASYARPRGLQPHTDWVISVHPAQGNDLVLLHELAHCAAPRYRLAARRRRRNELPLHTNNTAHDLGFSTIMAAAVRSVRRLAAVVAPAATRRVHL